MTYQELLDDYLAKFKVAMDFRYEHLELVKKYMARILEDKSQDSIDLKTQYSKYYHQMMKLSTAATLAFRLLDKNFFLCAGNPSL